jgi:hypothetical protein
MISLREFVWMLVCLLALPSYLICEILAGEKREKYFYMYEDGYRDEIYWT